MTVGKIRTKSSNAIGQNCNGGVVSGASYPVKDKTMRLETAAPEKV